MKKTIGVLSLVLVMAFFVGGCSTPAPTSSSSGATEDPVSTEDMITDIAKWVTDDIWNKGFCEISWYAGQGTGSTGDTIDIEFTLEILSEAMKKKPEYDAFMSQLPDDPYKKLKSYWEKMSEQIGAVYSEIQKNKPEAKNEETRPDTGLFEQYSAAFEDEYFALME